MPQNFTASDGLTAESAPGNGKAGGWLSKEDMISLSVIFSMLLALLVGVVFVLVQLKRQKKIFLPQSRQGRRRKTDRNSSAEQGSQALMGSQAPRQNHSNSSDGNPNEPRMTVNVSNELSSAGATTSYASSPPPDPMSPPPAPARAPQICQRKLLRTSSSGGGGRNGGSSVQLQAGSRLHGQLPAASPPDAAASPRRRCRSADAPAEQRKEGAPALT